MPRLPSFDALLVFSAAARHRSFTAAAAELHRTQSAVSHRVKALEAELGVQLFRRLTRRLELTQAGQALADRVEQAVADIGEVIAQLDVSGETQRLSVTMLPSFASCWLMPRLPRFYERHPQLQVQVIAEGQIVDLSAAGVDCAIRFGPGRYAGYVTTLLMRDWVLPVCSPRLMAERGPIGSPDALLELPLLHDSTAEGDESRSDWRSWLDQLGRTDADCRSGQRFSQAGLVIEAAVFGLGVAVTRLSLVGDQLGSGALVCPFPFTAPTAYAYYLVARPQKAALPKIVDFRRWLQTEARSLRATYRTLHLSAQGTQRGGFNDAVIAGPMRLTPRARS